MLPEAVKPELGYFGFAGQFMETRLVKKYEMLFSEEEAREVEIEKMGVFSGLKVVAFLAGFAYFSIDMTKSTNCSQNYIGSLEFSINYPIVDFYQHFQ
jgi:hypothetical protein